MIELMVAVAVAAIMVSAVSLGFRGMMSATSLDAASRDVSAHLALARMRAVANLGRARLAFSPQLNAHWLEVFDDSAGGFVVEGPVVNLPQGVSVSSGDDGLAAPTSVFYVRFNSRGSAVDPSGTFVGEQSISLCDGHDTVRIVVGAGGQNLVR